MASATASEPGSASTDNPSASIRQNSSHSSPPPIFSSAGKLSPAQLQVAVALAEGKTVTAAAGQAGVHRSTVTHWLRNVPDFKRAAQEAHIEYQNNIAEELTELAATALSTLKTLVEDPQTPHSVRLKAALAILERPRFPKRSWTLPTSVENSAECQIAEELAFIEGDYKRMRMTEALGKPPAATRSPMLQANQLRRNPYRRAMLPVLAAPASNTNAAVPERELESGRRLSGACYSILLKRKFSSQPPRSNHGRYD